MEYTVNALNFIVLQKSHILHCQKQECIMVLGKSTSETNKATFLSTDMVLINIRKYFVLGCQVLRNDTVPSNMFLILVD